MRTPLCPVRGRSAGELPLSFDGYNGGVKL